MLRFRMVFSNYNLGMFELCLLFSSHLKLENFERKKKNQGQKPSKFRLLPDQVH